MQIMDFSATRARHTIRLRRTLHGIWSSRFCICMLKNRRDDRAFGNMSGKKLLLYFQQRPRIPFLPNSARRGAEFSAEHRYESAGAGIAHVERDAGYRFARSE